MLFSACVSFLNLARTFFSSCTSFNSLYFSNDLSRTLLPKILLTCSGSFLQCTSFYIHLPFPLLRSSLLYFPYVLSHIPSPKTLLNLIAQEPSSSILSSSSLPCACNALILFFISYLNNIISAFLTYFLSKFCFAVALLTKFIIVFFCCFV